MKAASSSNMQRDSNRNVSTGRPANWVWWGLVGAVAVVMIVSVMALLFRDKSGVGRNRGPASEAAPGNQPSRDIDRSRAR